MTGDRQGTGRNGRAWRRAGRPCGRPIWQDTNWTSATHWTTTTMTTTDAAVETVIATATVTTGSAGELTLIDDCNGPVRTLAR